MRNFGRLKGARKDQQADANPRGRDGLSGGVGHGAAWVCRGVPVRTPTLYSMISAGGRGTVSATRRGSPRPGAAPREYDVQHSAEAVLPFARSAQACVVSWRVRSDDAAA